MTTPEIIKELSKKDPNEIEFCLSILLQAKKIDFLRLQGAYVKYLEESRDKDLSKIIEAETCVAESLLYDKIQMEDKQTEISVQRRLYLLNQSRRFQMDELNKKFGYSEARAKTYNHEEDY